MAKIVKSIGDVLAVSTLAPMVAKGSVELGKYIHDNHASGLGFMVDWGKEGSSMLETAALNGPMIAGVVAGTYLIGRLLTSYQK